MGILLGPDGQRLHLAPFTTVGRMAGHHLVLTGRDISKIHAELFWGELGWVIQDKSSNGTFLDGKRLTPGVSTPVEEGTRIRFSSSEWLMVSAGPPRPMAFQEGSSEKVAGMNGLLNIPDGDNPEVCVFLTPRGWVMEAIGYDGVRPAHDEMRVSAGGRSWILSLPGEPVVTYNNAIWLEGARLMLRIRHSQDLEHLQVSVLRGERELVEWSARTYLQVLFLLAQVRQDDEQAHRPRPGWRSRDDLSRMLRIEKNTLHQHIFRVRKSFRALGEDVEEQSIIESEDRMVRLGIRDIQIEPL